MQQALTISVLALGFLLRVPARFQAVSEAK